MDTITNIISWVLIISELIKEASLAIAETIIWLIIAFFAVMTFIEIMGFYGIKVPVLSEIIRRKELERLKHFYRNEAYLLYLQDEHRIDFLLRQLGLTKKQFKNLAADMAGIKLEASKNIREEKSVFERTISCEACRLDQRSIDIDKRLYPYVDVYLDFNGIMFEDNVRVKMLNIFDNYLKKNITKEEMAAIDLIVTPKEGNYLFGYYTARLLNKTFIGLRHKPRVLSDKYWDGDLPRGGRALIVNDVSVTGRKLADAIEYLESKNIEVSGVYVLVERLDYKVNARIYIANHREDVNFGSYRTLTDKAIQNIYEKYYEEIH